MIMNFLRNKKQRKNNISKRNGDSGRRNTVIGYGLLTLAVIWSAALVPSIGEISDFGVWLPPLLLTLFVLAIGLVLWRAGKEYDY